MEPQAPLIFVCLSRKHSTIDWVEAEPRFQVLYTTLPDVVLTSVRRANGPGTGEIDAVIFDQSVSELGFRDFLAEVACEFQGDVLLINRDESAQLSSISAGKGRRVSRLDPAGVRLYAATKLGIYDPLFYHDREQRVMTA